MLQPLHTINCGVRKQNKVLCDLSNENVLAVMLWILNLTTKLWQPLAAKGSLGGSLLYKVPSKDQLVDKNCSGLVV